MKIFKVSFTEVLRYETRVAAHNKEDAENLALERYNEDMLKWHDNSLEEFCAEEEGAA